MERLHLVRDAAAEKEFDITVTLEHVSLEIRDPRKQKWTKNVSFNKDLKIWQSKQHFLEE